MSMGETCFIQLPTFKQNISSSSKKALSYYYVMSGKHSDCLSVGSLVLYELGCFQADISLSNQEHFSASSSFFSTGTVRWLITVQFLHTKPGKTCRANYSIRFTYSILQLMLLGSNWERKMSHQQHEVMMKVAIRLERAVFCSYNDEAIHCRATERRIFLLQSGVALATSFLSDNR